MSRDATSAMLERIGEDNVRFLHLQFTDLLGMPKNVAIPVKQAEKALTGGIGFDGSSIQGFVRIEESDMILKPDLSTYTLLPWRSGEYTVARFMCDVYKANGKPFEGDPRYVLRTAMEDAARDGYIFNTGPELEFFLFQESMEQAWKQDFKGLTPSSPYVIDYHILQTSKDEWLIRKIRNDMAAAGIPVENSKGEAEAGQEEVNYRYSDALDTADNHVIIKNAIKEIAWAKGKSVTFMAKYDHRRAGSSSHIHQSLWSKDGKASFADKADGHGMSEVMKHYLAGQLHHARDITAFLAPYVNSYKRFTVGMFAPTKAVWSADNRTAGFRVCGVHTKAVRVECRIPGSDVNPYLACAALLAAGLDGIEKKMALEPELTGDMYSAKGIREIPHTLREAAELLNSSQMLRQAFGDDVIDHYHHAAQWEIAETDRVVTDFERERLLERA